MLRYRYADPSYVDGYGCNCTPDADSRCDCECEQGSSTVVCDCKWLRLVYAEFRSAPPEVRAAMRASVAHCVCGLGDWKDEHELGPSDEFRCGGGFAFWAGVDDCSCREGDPYFDRAEGELGGEWVMVPPVLGDCPCDRPGAVGDFVGLGDQRGGVGGLGDLPLAGTCPSPSAAVPGRPGIA